MSKIGHFCQKIDTSVQNYMMPVSETKLVYHD